MAPKSKIKSREHYAPQTTRANTQLTENHDNQYYCDAMTSCRL